MIFNKNCHESNDTINNDVCSHDDVVIRQSSVNPLMPGGNKKVTHT